MTNIAVIPARSGSKRIPGKNIRKFNGVENIVRAVELAKTSEIFDKIIVSTNSEAIAELAISAGAEVPFMRTEELSDDYATTIDVIQDVFVRSPNLSTYKYTCCIYPVTPLLKPRHLIAAHLKLQSSNCDYVIAGLEDKTSVYRHFELGDKGKIKFIFPEFLETRTQDLQRTFSDGGQFYFGKTSSWIQGVPLLSSKSEIIEFTNMEIVDIDNLDDWKYAEYLVSLNDRDDR